MKILVVFIFILGIASCGKTDTHTSTELIKELESQHSLFKNLMMVTNQSIPDSQLKDSLAFLILPIQASCPSCRKKTIDSIVRHENDLKDGHYIIISASAGKKNINSYFVEENAQLPNLKAKLYLDTINQAYKLDLVEEKPTMYYSFNSKVYKKVSAIPATVKEDLKEFFLGYRKVK